MWMPDHYGSSLSDVAVIGRLRPTQRAACTRLVGVCAFSGTLRGLELVPAK